MEKSVKEHSELKNMKTRRVKQIDKLPQSEQDTIEWLVDAIGAVGLDEFMEYIRSPWKMLWPNFVAWVARGFGALVWAAIVIALVWWVLSTLIDLPLIGKKLEPYVSQVQTEFSKFTEATNYNPHFTRMESTLESIHAELKKLNASSWSLK